MQTYIYVQISSVFLKWLPNSSTLGWWDFTLHHGFLGPPPNVLLHCWELRPQGQAKTTLKQPPQNMVFGSSAQIVFPSRVTPIASAHIAINHMFSYPFLVTETPNSLRTGCSLGKNWVGDDRTGGNLSCFLPNLGVVWDNRPEEVLTEKNCKLSLKKSHIYPYLFHRGSICIGKLNAVLSHGDSH